MADQASQMSCEAHYECVSEARVVLGLVRKMLTCALARDGILSTIMALSTPLGCNLNETALINNGLEVRGSGGSRSGHKLRVWSQGEARGRSACL
jgi:hypothetical protein